MQKFGIAIWKRVPFLRILLPMIGGIIIQFYLSIPSGWILSSLVAGILLLLSSKLMRTAKLFRLIWTSGLGSHLAFFALGSLLVNANDIRNDADWIGHHYQTGDVLIVTIKETLVEKPGSYKALAVIE